jgi:hypothetical protein
MKYSISFNKNIFSGWVEKPSEIRSIKLIRSDSSFIEVAINSTRPDVVKAGITDCEVCGFVFNNPIDTDIEDGNFFLVEIESNTKMYRKSFFIGDKEKWKEKFEGFQVVDRNDFSIQEDSIENVFRNNSDVIAFKLLMIRLRRGKRAFGWRGTFKGNVYQEMDNDWQRFKRFYECYFSILKDILYIRSLWSVLDTFSDFGDSIEKACSLSVSNYMFQERFAQTFRRIYKFEEIENKEMLGQTPYWGGMATNQLERDDSYDVFFTKNIEVLEMSPIIKKTFGVIFLESLNAELSILNINQSHSPFFKETFQFYKNYFESYIAKDHL